MSFDYDSNHSAADFDASTRGPAGGVPSPAVAAADSKIACIDRYRAVIGECGVHMKLAIGVPRVLEEGVAQVDETAWRTLFTAHATAMDKCNGMSISMMGFMALCLQEWCADPSIEQEYPTLESCMNEAYVRWALMSTRHTLSARQDWPMRQEWIRFRRMVTASIVHGWYKIGGGEALRTKLEGTGGAREQGPVTAAEAGALSKSIFPPTNPPELGAIWQDRREPLALRLELEAEEKKARADLAAGKKDVKIGVSAEASGTVWREQPEERVRNFPFQMARLIVRVEADEALLMELNPQAAYSRMRFSAPTFAKVEAWMKLKLAMEQPEQTTAKFRDIITRQCLPIGTDDEKYRRRETVADKKTAMDLLSNEIGANLSQYLNDRLLKEMRVLLHEAIQSKGGEDTVGALAFDAILMTLLESECVQKLKFKFLEQYVILAPHTPEALKRLRSDRYRGEPRKRPLIVFLCATYWLQYRKQLVPCGPAFIDAFLAWLCVMRRDFTIARTDPTAHVPLTPQQMRDPAYAVKVMLEQNDNVGLLCTHFLIWPGSLLALPRRGPEEEEARESVD